MWLLGSRRHTPVSTDRRLWAGRSFLTHLLCFRATDDTLSFFILQERGDWLNAGSRADVQGETRTLTGSQAASSLQGSGARGQEEPQLGLSTQNKTSRFFGVFEFGVGPSSPLCKMTDNVKERKKIKRGKERPVLWKSSESIDAVQT